MNVRKMGKDDKPLDVVSTILAYRGIPTISQFQQVANESTNSEAFWFSLALSHGIRRRSDISITRHLYDVARRPVARNRYSVTLLENGIASVHDITELDFLEDTEEARGIRPFVASLSMLGILDRVLGEEVAYGIKFDLPQSLNGRFGGVNSLTNYPRIVSKMASPRLISNDDFYNVRNKNGREVAFLTEAGRKFFLTRLDRQFGNGFNAELTEVGQTYIITVNRISEFLSELEKVHTYEGGKKKGKRLLTSDERREISDIVEPFKNTIRRAPIKVSVGNTSIDELAQSNYETVRAAFSNTETIRPVDMGMVPSNESPYEAILKKTAYSAFVRNIGGGVRTVAEVLGQSLDQSYLHPLMVKIMDTTDNVSTMGPNLNNITSIYRKARIVFNDGIETLKYLNELGVPKEGRQRLHQALSLLIERTDDGIKHWKKFFVNAARTESEYSEGRDIMNYMHQLHERSNYYGLLYANKPSGGVFGRINSLRRVASNFYSW